MTFWKNVLNKKKLISSCEYWTEGLWFTVFNFRIFWNYEWYFSIKDDKLFEKQHIDHFEYEPVDLYFVEGFIRVQYNISE